MTPLAASQVDIVDTAMSLPGFLTRDECRFLHKTSLSSSAALFVEIGSWQGRSTFVLCAAAREVGAKVVSVENFSAPPGVRYVPSSHDLLSANLRRLGFAPTIIVADSELAAARVGERVGLLFIDADHRREPLIRDVRAWFPKLDERAIVLFHDYNHPRWPAVAPVVDQLVELAPENVRPLGRRDRLVAVVVEGEVGGLIEKLG